MQLVSARSDRHVGAGTVILLALALVAYIWEMRTPLLQLDDAFISYRYAQNLVEGHGLVFNIGERVEGYTNLLWVLLAALGMKLGFDAPIFGHWLCAGSGALLLLSSYFYAAILLPRSARLLAALAPLVLLSFNTFVLWTSSGLEQGLFSALAIFALCAGTLKRIWWACCFCVLATLTRPEGALVAALLLNVPWLSAIVRERERDWRKTLPVLMPALVFGIFILLLTLCRWFYYGDIVPNTFRAKIGGIPFWWGTRYLRQFALDGVGFLIIGTLLAAVWVPRFRLGFSLLLIFVAYIVWIRGDVFPMGRFMLPVLPVLVAGGLLAAHAAWHRSRFVSILLAAMVPLSVFFSLYVQPPESRESCLDFKLLFKPDFPYSFKRADHYVSERWYRQDVMAARLQGFRQANPPVHLVASIGIGRIAYYGRDLEVLDLVGLTDKTIAKSTRPPPKNVLLMPGHQRSDPDYVFSRKPDVIDIAKKDAPILVLPAIRDLWNDPRLERDYHWSDSLGGYWRNE